MVSLHEQNVLRFQARSKNMHMFGVNMPFSQRSRPKIAAAFPTVGAVQLKIFEVFNSEKILLTSDI